MRTTRTRRISVKEFLALDMPKRHRRQIEKLSKKSELIIIEWLLDKDGWGYTMFRMAFRNFYFFASNRYFTIELCPTKPAHIDIDIGTSEELKLRRLMQRRGYDV
jgi:hypothetical protein